MDTWPPSWRVPRRWKPATTPRSGGICCRRFSGWGRTEVDSDDQSSIHIRTVGHGLAALAPVGDTRLGALLAQANRIAAVAARLARAAIDPQHGAGVGLVRGAALAASVGHDGVSGVNEHIGRE